MRRARSLACCALLLGACRGEDAYLGGGHAPYQCGTRCYFEQGTPAEAANWFFNAEAELGAGPEIVYPLKGSVHPEDLRQLTVQFQRGRSDFTVFRIRVQSSEPGPVYDFFTPCLAIGRDGCRYLLKGTIWNNARADLRGLPAVLSVTGSSGPDGVMKTSGQVPLTITPSDLSDKGFYYWTTVPLYASRSGDSETGIFRLPFGADQAEPYIMPNTETNRRQCGACHSVSRDGSTIAFTARNNDGALDQRSGVLVATSTANPEMPFIEPAMDATYDSSMMALSSKGTRVLVAYADRLALRSAEDDGSSVYRRGDEITSLSRVDLGGKIGYFPEFSPEDDAVVLTLSDRPDSAIAVQSGDIAVLDFDILNASFSAPKIVVEGTAELFHFYPTWSPDGNYIAFASAPRELAEDGFPSKSYDQKKARLRLVRRDGGAVYELANATHELNKWSTFPKFAPFSEGDRDGPMFLTFNSKINYGLLLNNDDQPNDAARLAQLWMSAIDVSKLPEDPSSPPIWLPFQDATQPSHLGIWTSDVKCRTDVGGSGCDIGQECREDPRTKTKSCVVEVK